MLSSTHRFYVSIRDAGGKEVLRKEVDTLQPVYEDLLFSSVVTGKLPNDGVSVPASLSPEFRQGKLYCLHGKLGCFQKSYTKDLFRDDALSLLASKEIKERYEGETLSWDVEAEPREQLERKRRISVMRAPFPFSPRKKLPVELESSELLSVFISSDLLGAIKKDAARCLDRERADALTGHLYHSGSRAAVVLDGRIPFPEDADASAIHYAFTPAAFAEVEEKHRQLDDGTTVQGWSHNHPPLPCLRDCLATVPPCKTDMVFLSTDDRDVFRASFSAPYQVGLVSGKGSERRADDPIVRAYGWRHGALEEINYVVY